MHVLLAFTVFPQLNEVLSLSWQLVQNKNLLCKSYLKSTQGFTISYAIYVKTTKNLTGDWCGFENRELQKMVP